MAVSSFLLSLIIILVLNVGCGVRGRPQPPLTPKEPVPPVKSISPEWQKDSK